MKITDVKTYLVDAATGGGWAARSWLFVKIETDEGLYGLGAQQSGLVNYRGHDVRLVQDLLAERRSRGRTTILSTHQMNQVEALCDRVALINKGRLMVYGAVAEVRRRYSRPEVLVRATGALPPVPQAAAVAHDGDGAWRVTLANGSQPSELLSALVSAGAVIDGFEPMLAPMEDIFLHVVREEQA